MSIPSALIAVACPTQPRAFALRIQWDEAEVNRLLAISSEERSAEVRAAADAFAEEAIRQLDAAAHGWVS